MAPARCRGCNGLALLQLWRGLQLQLGFNPWPRNFHKLWVVMEGSFRKYSKASSYGRNFHELWVLRGKKKISAPYVVVGAAPQKV